MDRNGYLKKLAKEAGYDNVDDFVLACEMLGTSRKMGQVLDSAFLPEDLDKYLADVDIILYENLKKQ